MQKPDNSSPKNKPEPRRMRRKLKLLTGFFGLWLGLMLVLLAALWPASTYAYSTNFNSYPDLTPAEALGIPGLTFTAAPGGSWIIGTSFFSTLNGKILYQPLTAGTLTIAFAAPQNNVSFGFATTVSTPLVVRGYFGGSLVFSNNFSGSFFASGFFEGLATVGAPSIDSVQLSVASGLIAIDDLVTNPAPPTPTPTISATPTNRPTPTPTPRAADPADIVAQLRVTPDRVAANDAENLITYRFAVKNIGVGEASSVALVLPIDPQLVVGFADLGSSGAWVTSVTTETLTIGLPTLRNSAVVTGAVTFRPKANATPDTKISTRYTIRYDDPTGAGRQRLSNAVDFSLGAAGSNLNVADGAIQLLVSDSPTASSKQTYRASFLIPNELTTAWLTRPDGTSPTLGTGRANQNGEVSLTVDTAGLAAGTYTVALFGNRSEVTGSGNLVVNAVTVANPGDGWKR